MKEAALWKHRLFRLAGSRRIGLLPLERLPVTPGYSLCQMPWGLEPKGMCGRGKLRSSEKPRALRSLNG